MDDYQQYIYKSRYARFIPELGRRENWPETVKRYCDFFQTKYPDLFPYDRVYNSILNMEVMPSMRCLLTAGKALERDNVAGYNCAYVAVNDVKVFDEILYILMCGTGVGFSVERQDIVKLPLVAEEFHSTDSIIKVRDSKIGWATSLRELISLLYSGKVPKWDLSALRPTGAPLKTFGGRSSGPGPLDELFHFAVKLFKKAAGRRLTSLECHDLVCKIADSVVVGGVRRSALISLSNLSDDRMRHAKNGQWWEENVQRALANNSVAYTEKPDMGIFMEEWKTLYESKSGERGIFNRVAATNQCKLTGRRKTDGVDYGTNPCGEIILRPAGFCNLSEVVVRPSDKLEDLKRKTEVATIIGTFQSTLTNFRYLRAVWKHNAEEERLLGVSLTGIMDHSILNHTDDNCKTALQQLKDLAIQTNKTWADKLEINQSGAITCVKPSGTVSQLVDSSSGIHARFSDYYIRTVRADKTDPLAKFLKESGVPCEDDITKPEKTYVFSFPRKAPNTSIKAKEQTALDQLEHYLFYRKNWCEHNPSITIYVKEHEWLDVGAWVYKNFDQLCGVSFLPFSDHVYKQAPYQEIDEITYNTLASVFPKINWDEFKAMEHEDNTTGMQELSCSAGVCEI